MHVISDLVSQLFEWIQSLGYIGIMIGLMIEVIPSEIVLAYGGYLVHLGEINFFGAVLFGTIGGVIAQIFVYWIGRYGGRPVLERYGKYIFIKKHHIDHAEAWFEKYGTGVIFTARFIPVVRHAISVPAGISRMPLWRFIVLTTLAVIPWSVLFVYLGMSLGENWENIDEKASAYTHEIIIGAIALIVVYFLFKWIHSKKKRGNAA
ncbi:DedA family protein [Paenibacillus sp. URB8-2]|uniref:DedA family protein n=1 Tax=Paenibacillus sp. URB8-2 TaxID=2741301 RepID=UPI0015C0B98E|nr:DedA family protein [Paenibacillus sp. URB8-2]BCG61010.1 membrane protein [Paenibacillus sp. URB8-2]